MEIENRKETKKQREIRELKDFFLKILMVVFLVVFLVSGGVLLNYYINYRQARSQKDEMVALHESLKASAQTESGEGAGDDGASAEKREIIFQEMRKINPDYIGWITIADTGIDYPVVYRDNNYYLNHNFEGEKNSHGAIFLDESCSPEDSFLLLHGHHMKDGTMFGELKQYNKADFRKNHRQVSLEFEYGDEHYIVFAVMRVDLTREDHFAFYKTPGTKEEAEKYLDSLYAAALWSEDYEFEWDSSRILLLSTCEYGTADERLVVAAVSQ